MRISQDWQAATVRRTTSRSPSVRELELQPDAGCTRPAPGSHLPVRLTTADGRVLVRQYSLLGCTDDGQAWRIAVKRCQPSRGGSAAMHALAAGDVLQVQAPQNHFALSVRAPQHLLVAGGIGITPLLGMAQALADRGADLRLLYAVRSADELVYADSLRALLGGRLQTFVSAQGQRLDLAAEVARLQPDAQLLLCGPAGLTRAAQAAWHAAGRPAHRLRFETFGAVATEAEAFWVQLPRHGLRFDVAADQTLLQALDAQGIATLRDCQRGECGLCAMDVLQVDGRIDHHDVFLSHAERDADRRLCACVSRVRGGGIVLDTAYRPDPA
jgi:vanillate O-demethylase ferredoxin subunit